VGNLRIVYLANQLDHCRLGFAVSRKYGNAVQRNWLKRQLRSCFRSSHEHDSTAADILVIPAVGANQIQTQPNPNSAVTSDLIRAMSIIRGKLAH